MAKKSKMSFDVSAFEDVVERFEALDSEIEEGVEMVLLRSYDLMQPKLEEAVTNADLPAGGKYSTGNLKSSVIRGRRVLKDGVYYVLPFGFDKSKAPYSHYLIKGTPKMKKSKKLWTVFESKKTINELNNLQQKVMWSYFAYKKDQRKG